MTATLMPPAPEQYLDIPQRMYPPPPESPRLDPTPLSTSSRPSQHRHRQHPSMNGLDDVFLDQSDIMSQNPYQHADEDPLEALCAYYNVSTPPPTRAVDLRQSHDLPLLRPAHPTAPHPTHLLAAFDLSFNIPHTPITLIPVNIDALAHTLRTDVLPPRLPPPARPPSAHSTALTLPVVPLHVPHAPSLPLLLLYTLGARRGPSALAAHLLPLAAAAEFPSAAAMAQLMAAAGAGARRAAYNEGAWQNVLVLGPREREIVRVVQMVWAVTAEARRTEEEMARGRERRRRERAGG